MQESPLPSVWEGREGWRGETADIASNYSTLPPGHLPLNKEYHADHDDHCHAHPDVHCHDNYHLHHHHHQGPLPPGHLCLSKDYGDAESSADKNTDLEYDAKHDYDLDHVAEDEESKFGCQQSVNKLSSRSAP